MKNHLNRFLIVKFGSLGDIVHCLPSVAQLRAAFPSAEIDWLIERKNKIAVEMSGLDVRLIPIDTYQWRNSPGIGSAKEIGEFVWALRTDGYDCAIDFQGLLKSAFFAYLSGAPVRIGWERDFLRESVSRIFYTEVVKPKRVHIIDHSQSAGLFEQGHMRAEIIGIRSNGDRATKSGRLGGILSSARWD